MMNTCNVWLHGSSRKGVIRWPKKCSHNETLLRVIKDALCIPIHIKIQVRALDKKVLDDNENSLLDSPTASTSLQTNSNDNNVISFIRIGEMGAIVSLEAILEGKYTNILVTIEDNDFRSLYPHPVYLQSIVNKKGVISHANNNHTKNNSNTLLSYEPTPSIPPTTFSVSTYFYQLFPFLELKSNKGIKDGYKNIGILDGDNEETFDMNDSEESALMNSSKHSSTNSPSNSNNSSNNNSNNNISSNSENSPNNSNNSSTNTNSPNRITSPSGNVKKSPKKVRFELDDNDSFKGSSRESSFDEKGGMRRRFKKIIEDVEDRDVEEDDAKVNCFDSQVEPQYEFRGSSFQNQLTKFQRVLAHLVNERTLLAWIRTDLAFITIAFKFMKLGNVYYDRAPTSYGVGAAELLFVCGGLYVLVLPVSLVSGYRRFQRCKEMLDFDLPQISQYLKKMTFDVDTLSLALLITFSFIGIVFGSTLIIWKSVGSNNNNTNDDIIIPFND